MGLFDKILGTDSQERSLRLAGLGDLLMGADQGRSADISPYVAGIATARDNAAFKDQLQNDPMMAKFSAEERSFLTTLPPQLAQKMIAERMFAKPDPTTYGWQTMQDGSLIRTDSQGGFQQMGNFAKPEKTDPWDGLKVINDQVVRAGDGGLQVVGNFGSPNEEAYETRQVKLSDGSEVLVERRKGTSDPWLPSQVPEGGTSGSGQPVKLSEAQAKTTLFKNMQSETTPVLGQIETAWDPSNIGDAIARSTPIAGNFFQSEQGQVYQSAASAWAEGALRITTGAAATQPEIDRVLKTYFATPGDTPNVIEFKKRMRDMFNRSIDASLGQTSGQSGKLELPMDFAERYLKTGPETAQEAIPQGIDPEDWKFMSDEDKALFK